MPNLPPKQAERLGLVADALGLPATGRTAQRMGRGRGHDVYKVTADGRPVVVRLAPPRTADSEVDRDAEHRNARIAASSGSGPSVLAHLPELGALVVTWVDGRTLTDRDLRDETMLGRVAAAVRRLHAGPRFITDLDVFVAQRRYLATARAGALPLPPGVAELAGAVGRVEAALAVLPERTVPCHNDLVASNLVDDGRRVWLVDFEYAANNDPCFDVGNLWAAADLPSRDLDVLVTNLFGRPSRRRVARARLLGAVASYTWAVWATIKRMGDRAPHYYPALAAAAMAKAHTELTGPDLDRLLDEVGEPD